MAGKKKIPTLSVVTPAYNEAESLPLLYSQLVETLDGAGIAWEWIVVDDHSGDATFEILSAIAKKDERVRAMRFSRNFGSYTAIQCGLEHAEGACAVGMAADLQDPPTLIPQMMAEWRDGAQVVWAARESRTGEAKTRQAFARLYYAMMRRMEGMETMPATGADFFLLDRRVVDVLNQFGEKNLSLFALITWMGFRQRTIRYDKRVREHGISGWGFKQKVKAVIDSITAFSYKPIQAMTILGFVIAALSFVYLLVVLINYLMGNAPAGWTSQMAAILLMGGLQMVMINC